MNHELGNHIWRDKKQLGGWHCRISCFCLPTFPKLFIGIRFLPWYWTSMEMEQSSSSPVSLTLSALCSRSAKKPERLFFSNLNKILYKNLQHRFPKPPFSPSSWQFYLLFSFVGGFSFSFLLFCVVMWENSYVVKVKSVDKKANKRLYPKMSNVSFNYFFLKLSSAVFVSLLQRDI